jgi:hypothetical protein
VGEKGRKRGGEGIPKQATQTSAIGHSNEMKPNIYVLQCRDLTPKIRSHTSWGASEGVVGVCVDAQLSVRMPRVTHSHSLTHSCKYGLLNLRLWWERLAPSMPNPSNQKAEGKKKKQKSKKQKGKREGLLP